VTCVFQNHRRDTGWCFSPFSFVAFLFLPMNFFVGFSLSKACSFQLTPNYILHIAYFITLCEFFLGIDPHWARKIIIVWTIFGVLSVSATKVATVARARVSRRSHEVVYQRRNWQTLASSHASVLLKSLVASLPLKIPRDSSPKLPLPICET
jgi:hypothetical protein